MGKLNYPLVRLLSESHGQTPEEIASLTGYPVSEVSQLLSSTQTEIEEVESTGSPESLLSQEVKRASLFGGQYILLESKILEKFSELLDSDEMSVAGMQILVRALKELRSMAPAQQLLPKQEDTKPGVTVQFLNSNQLLVQ